eukprot:TRINITY_DN1012_c0_g1_i2.p1 TRINITY_DN1012_c0_g1~~TRINITY_DN1012_c0_g1_i2.p1  ORF type:complete len:179 (-),score=7.79 TRINITY_DN1012_c0_g1_i2:759-1295(-)
MITLSSDKFFLPHIHIYIFLRSRIEARTALKVSGTLQNRLIARAHSSPISLSRNISRPTTPVISPRTSENLSAYASNTIEINIPRFSRRRKKKKEEGVCSVVVTKGECLPSHHENPCRKKCPRSGVRACCGLGYMSGCNKMRRVVERCGVSYSSNTVLNGQLTYLSTHFPWSIALPAY